MVHDKDLQLALGTLSHKLTKAALSHAASEVAKAEARVAELEAALKRSADTAGEAAIEVCRGTKPQ